ncbi:hypothetical protein LOC68_04100 [Blastopirellula sp. JC732]|uniref:Uncharacterized protein n=1 Tax=Blastopirellula sediminis TaxID=2894196 RepID=A0A9X1MIM9_9BACT|nr:hypothetical protein [Blastopirellula sediminis]MCC9609660.1 hypothetical protein [Blastopirellula sediminis]MCC9627564.1 hypothetical protein [Blastopirellula sediminis]
MTVAIGTENVWLRLLKAWPEKMPQQGIVVTELNEQIPFTGFIFDDEIMILQRPTPDAMGGRQVIVPFQSISYVKITAVVPPKLFNDFGFTGALPKV